jgi:hypothetical protein
MGDVAGFDAAPGRRIGLVSIAGVAPGPGCIYRLPGAKLLRPESRRSRSGSGPDGGRLVELAVALLNGIWDQSATATPSGFNSPLAHSCSLRAGQRAGTLERPRPRSQSDSRAGRWLAPRVSPAISGVLIEAGHST